MTDQFFDGPEYEDLLAAAMYGHSLSEAQKLIDAFAHALAERIRKQTARGNMIREEFADPWEMGLLRASDVIDPWPDGEEAGPMRSEETSA